MDEIITGIINNDTENDYTSNWCKAKLKKHFYDMQQEDIDNYDFCVKNSIKYYDTYKNREEIFYEILNYIDDIES